MSETTIFQWVKIRLNKKKEVGRIGYPSKGMYPKLLYTLVYKIKTALFIQTKKIAATLKTCRIFFIKPIDYKPSTTFDFIILRANKPFYYDRIKNSGNDYGCIYFAINTRNINKECNKEKASNSIFKEKNPKIHKPTFSTLKREQSPGAFVLPEIKFQYI